MAISKYFDEFPLRHATTDGITTKVVTDIFRRVRIREDYKELVHSYYTEDLNDAERPDQLAAREYNQPTLHWMTMLVNDVVNPYHDWVMTDKTLENFVAIKYPNRYLQLASSHFDSTDKLFLPNETITSGSSVGTVVNFDTTNLQVIYTLTSSGNFANTNTITGGTSGVTGTVNGTPGLEVDATSHYEIQRDLNDGTTERIAVDKDVTRQLPNPINNNVIETYVATAVSYYQNESNKNDDNRTVKLLDPDRIVEFTKDFKKKIRI